MPNALYNQAVDLPRPPWAIHSLDRELQFTKVYQAQEQAPPLTRELLCMRAQLPALFAPIQPGDWLAGRLRPLAVGVSPEPGGLGYYCAVDELRPLTAEPSADPELRAQAAWLLDFWDGRTTSQRCRAAFSPKLAAELPCDDFTEGSAVAYPLYRIAGLFLDYDLLMRLGIEGLRERVRARRRQGGPADAHALAFFDALEGALDLFGETAHWYAEHAHRQAAAAGAAEQARLELIAESLEWVAEHAPRSYHQGLQLAWLYSLAAQTLNYGRMDIYLGKLLATDLDQGRLSQANALAMTTSLWQLMNARGNVFNNRIIIGGMGRPDPGVADRFALLALEAQRATNNILPMLTLRWHEGMAPALWRRALDVIGAGNTFPILYNDDVNVPALSQALKVSFEEAEQYLPLGCGEYVLDHSSLGSPNGTLNLLKVLDATLHGAPDAPARVAQGLRAFQRFDELRDAYACEVERQVRLLVEAEAIIYRVTGAELAFPLVSLLYDDCVVRGLPLLQGGVRYLSGTLETYGNTSAADSLLAIRAAVYERGLLTADELLACLDCNFVGHERERRMLHALPKFGNDDESADAMNLWVNQQVCGAISSQAEGAGLHSYLAVLINNGTSVIFGKTTAASADGRRAGEPLSNGNQPSAGNDRNGPTALLNSMAKLDPALHAGAVHNLKLGRALFTHNRPALDALVRGYFAAGGTQVMITVVDRGELEAALLHPERYGHLIVRVGGYSERFVNLPRAIQLDIIQRTLYE